MSLLQALDQGDNDEVQRVLQEHPEEIEFRDDDDRVALHYAACRSDMTTLKLIYVGDRSLVDASDKTGLTPLLVALQDGRTDSAEFLAKNGADVNHVDKDGRNAVHWTVVCGQLEALNWAISKNVDVNLKDNLQMCTPLHYSTSHEDMPVEVGQAVLITLLQHGADANCRDTDHRTPMHWCAANGNLDAMEALCKHDGDLSIKDKDLLSVLHCAASHGYHEMIEFCMGKVSKVMIDESDRAGHTALFYAVSFGHYESALKLLQHGANPNHQDQRLRTASHSAAARGQMRMLKLLRQYNASFDIQNYRGDTPFHEAVQSGSKDVVEWLLAMDGSVLDTPNHSGRTGLHLAAAAGNMEMTIVLCMAKCFVDPLMSFKDKFYTPLDLADEQKHKDVAQYLRTLCSAKNSKDFSPEYIEEWKTSFETIVAEAKRKRNQQLTEYKRRDRRPSTNDGIAESVKLKQKEIVEVGVMTSGRNIQSADSNRTKRKYSKSTSVTNLIQVPSIPKQELEALKASIENGQKMVDEEDEDHIDILDIDEEFENLPPISDLSESSSSSSLDSEDDERSGDEQERKITVKEVNAEIPSSMRKNEKKTKKEVRIESGGQGNRKKRSPSSEKPHGNLVMRVRREPEIGSDGGDVEIYDDGDGKTSDDEEKTIHPSSLTNKRFIHERSIFQELTHLKRMQIQYGKVVKARRDVKALCRSHAFPVKIRGAEKQVQEKVLVRSLISNFCKMHNLDVRNFKFMTFYAWEKFLYDALSEQLKIIYLEERERINETNSEMKAAANMKLSKFDSKIRKSVPATDKMRDMQRIYSHTTISRSSRPNGASQSASKLESSRKRCDCLDKHLLL